MPAPIRSLPPPSKKRKTNSSPSSNSIAIQIQSLESTLTNAVQSSASLNPLADLLDLAQTTVEAKDVSKIIYALYRVFVVLIGSGKMSAEGQTSEKGKVVRAWLWERLGAYQDLLVGLMKDEDADLRISSLQILFSLQKHLSSILSSASASSVQPQFHVSHFKKIVSGLLLCPPSMRNGASGSGKFRLEPDVRNYFVDTWFSVHDDIRWFFLREAVPILNASNSSSSHTPANLLSILERLNTFPTEQAELNTWWIPELGSTPKPSSSKKSKLKGRDELHNLGSDEESEMNEGGEDEEDDWRKFFDDSTPTSNLTSIGPRKRLHKLTVQQSLHSLPSHRAVFTRAWLALLPTLSEAGTRRREGAIREEGKEERRTLTVRALNIMHRGVMPHLTRAVLVMDWVAGCVDFGGTVGLLALNALFVLMTEYNLDYPSFYTRLYAFLDRDVLHSRHRARFFRLTELFLGSTHLPATLLASFIKRLSRLSLNAPPAAIVMVIPFTYNILKRHPALMCMIHRLPAEDENDGVSTDLYNPTEPNPNLTDALESSLWELYSHKRHYHAGVSTLARVFEEAFTKMPYGMEDFLDHGYGTLLDTETKRKIKKEPALAVEMTADLFTRAVSTENEGAGGGDVVNDLWSFS
ncbi:hypothetical protein PILCRDRAFT_811012 [Piloderma croceum F 1598]|uniref:CCAAT-binding factor domain-containing protein n=1 Tax=Piloderma croceum (strain F 1598) TaxID=765440 RepID=A0A0C3CPW7_PILCF|nr:hypothetical protein PILCRDRAFT_811012 [Piloderma croceum F 1598]